ncbi:hypothetical protein M9Y10_016996 [Tritrichomonas musculus]|uniref:Protein kinase domain-containing protein n=1 Tax=Tritrichomonas musculus TaxID=1915356 RepID=A0ABR2HXU5_9EUKA
MFKDLHIFNFKNLKREVSALAQLHHPSIIKFIGYSPVDFSNLPCPIIVTELCCNRSLYDTLNLIREEKTPSDWDDTKKVINLYEIASALAYLHSLNIVYRDVKLNNVLLDDYLFPKLIDFGLSKFLNEKERKQKQNEGQDLIENSDQCGTLFYMAPELISPGIDNPHFIKASDVYSFAITAYEIMTNLRPYHFTQAYKHMTYVGSGKRPKLTTPILDCYRNLIERCWSQDPNKRPSFDEIVTELKTNRDFITDSVNEEDFINYVQYIDESQ